MDILRKTLKILILVILLFMLLTIILAAVIKFTGFKEEWSFAGLIAILSLSTFVFGMLESGLTGKKGLVTGFISSLLFVALIIMSAAVFFADEFSADSFNVFYLIPVIAGAVGGILGVNRKING